METIAGIIAVIAIKLTAMIAGYKIVVLGHDTLVRGIKGDFEFTGSVDEGGGVKLKSASPGLLFILLGTLLIGWALFVEKPIKYSDTTTVSDAKTNPQSNNRNLLSTPDFDTDSASGKESKIK